MQKKSFILDTNVFLHDPHALSRFKRCEIIIPLPVLEELDKMKRFSDELGKNARHVIRFIDGLKGKENVHKGVDIDDETTLRLFILKPVDRKNFPLAMELTSSRILLAAHQLKGEGAEVTVITKDFLTRVKATSLGMEAQDYESLKESYDNLYKGMRKLEVTKAHIDQFYVDGKLQLNVDDFYPNEYCTLTCPENSSAICKYDTTLKGFIPLIPIKKDIWGINPLNVEQKVALDLLLRDDIKLVSLIGQAGTGKTLMALVCGLRKAFDEDVYGRILMSRPIMPLGKDIGFLPGTKEEKLYHWMQPIYDNLDFLVEKSDDKETAEDMKEWILESNKIELEAVTYIRGRSFSRTYVIIDEAQNLTPHEVKTIISRAGHGTKIILTGDPTQIDNPYLDKDSNALTYVVGKFKNEKIYGHVLLEKTERSELAARAADLL